MRRCFGKWIKEQVSEKIQCVVSAYNLRSQRFFKDLGFHPECVHFNSKSKNSLWGGVFVASVAVLSVH